ncbi:MAG TPA: M1 family metallopeptidase [Terriglobales bacterium]|nr:M1 family metallopeptidase [Terriglobales bacterium]
MKRIAIWGLLIVAAVSAVAQRLPDHVVPTHYNLTFEPDLVKAKFAGAGRIDIQVLKPTKTIVLNAVDITFDMAVVTSGGKSQDAAVSLQPEKEMATLTLADEVPAGPARIDIKFQGTLNDQLRGFYLSKSEKRNYAVTQMEPTDARRAFPSFDEPAMKASFDIRLIIDKDDTAISNGKIIKDEPGPGDGKHTLTFSTTPKMSTYLVAMAVGDFTCIEGKADDIPIRVCDIPGREKLLTYALKAAEENLKYFNRYYAIKYPYGKLDIIAFPDFSAGAMENTAAITYREVLLAIDPERSSVRTHKVVADVLSHEMAHQWFGDLVTAQWWDDIWLNEGFASWMSPKPLQSWSPQWHMEMDEVADNAQAMSTDSLRYTRAIRHPANNTAEITQQFDSIAYQKGAAVLRMIESYVGEQAFRDGVNEYLKEHAYGNATSEDFWNAQTRVSKKPVDKIMHSFVTQPGVPVVKVATKCEAGNTKVTLTQERFAYDPAVTQASKDALWQIPVCLRAPGGAPVCEVMSQKQQTRTLKGCAPYVYGNADGQGYYRSGYDSATLRRIAETALKDLKPTERAQLVNDAWALVRSGNSNVDDFLAMADGMQGEREFGVLQLLDRDLEFISDYLVTAADRPQYEAWVRSLLHPIAEGVGYHTAPNDDDNTKQLRASVLHALGYAGNDATVVKVAQEMTSQALAGDESDPSLFGGMVHIAAKHGDAALYDKVLARLKDPKLPPQEFYTWQFALGAFSDPALLKRTLEMVKTPAVRNQDAPQVIGEVWDNPAGVRLGWEFFKANWPELKTKMATYSYGQMAAGTGSFCEAGLRDEVQQFFSREAPQGKRSLDRALERIDNCIRLRQQQEPRLSAFLKNRKGTHSAGAQ